jgi:hypothetical protein
VGNWRADEGSRGRVEGPEGGVGTGRARGTVPAQGAAYAQSALQELSAMVEGLQPKLAAGDPYWQLLGLELRKVKRGLEHREAEVEVQPEISQSLDRAAALHTNPDAPADWSLRRRPHALERGRRGPSTYNKADNIGFTIQSPDKAEGGRAEPFPVVERSVDTCHFQNKVL